MADELKFKPLEPSCSIHNKAVRDHIVKEILSQPGNAFHEETVQAAVKRCYQNIRRTNAEQQDGKEEFVQLQARRRKYRSRLERKFQRRTSVVSNVEKEKYWKHLNVYYMTEESDDPSNPNIIIEHKLAWRSKKLDDYIQVLEGRLEKKQPQTIGLVAKKERVSGSPSASLPPQNAPSWAVINEEAQTTPIEGSN